MNLFGTLVVNEVIWDLRNITPGSFCRFATYLFSLETPI